jgi:hypothetical protein
MSNQEWFNLLSLLWATFHDFVYFGLYWVLTHFHLLGSKKHHASPEERIARLERIILRHTRKPHH